MRHSSRAADVHHLIYSLRVPWATICVCALCLKLELLGGVRVERTQT